MSTVLDPDLLRGAAYRNMVEHLAGPFRAGAQDTEVQIDGTGKASVDWEGRYPVLVAALRAPADAIGYVLTVTLPDTTKRTATFTGYTEAGAFLPLYVPVVDNVTHLAQKFAVKLALAGEATLVPVAVADIAKLVELRLVEGLLGRMLVVVSSEKARIRREARVLSAMTMLARARDDALDRRGADLGVPRFIESHQASGATVLDREADDDYRRRLRAYRPWLRSTKSRVAEILNGPGADVDPNAGPLGELGLVERFDVIDADNPFAVAMQLVATGDDAQRTNFITFARGAYLIWPKNNAAANAVHSGRFLPAGRAAHEKQLRSDLRALFDFTSDAATNPAVAPALAAALVRAAKARQALGIAGKWELKRAQKTDGGSRYELGLGADLVPFTAVELTNMVAAHAGANPADPEVRGLLAAMTPVAPADDPEGAWLLEKCGLRTVFRADSTTLYLSHFPAFGLVITGPTPVPAKGFAFVVPTLLGRMAIPGALLLYDRDAGQGQFLRSFLASDAPTQISLLGGLRKTWSQIVPGRFETPWKRNDLLFYERASGDVQFYSVSDNGAIALIGNASTSKSWTAVVPIELQKGYTSLFCYDRTTGQAQFFTTNGSGSLSKLGKPIEGLRRGWTHVIAGDFGGGKVADLLFFDRTTSEAQICTTDGYGALDAIQDLSWDTNWTHLVCGRFTVSDHDSVLFYDSANGAIEIYTALDGGSLDLVTHQEGLPTGWTHVIAGDYDGENDFWQLFAYDRVLGTAAWYVVDEIGLFVRKRLEQNWRKSDGYQFSANYMSAADPSSNVVLANGVTAAGAAWVAAGNAAWTLRTSATVPKQQTVWSQTVAPGAAAGVFTAAGLAAVPDPVPIVAKLNALPDELVNTLVLPAGLAAQIIAGSPAAPAQLKQLLKLLRDAGLTSALPLVASAGRVIVVTAVISLPQAGVNLAEQPATGFRWFVVPIEGPGGTIKTVGARTDFVSAGEGLSAVMAVGYAREGLADPYEYRIELPKDAVLSLHQYEFLMNLLEHATPVGVRVNTFEIRKEHVDANGDGIADPLDPTISRTYRTFRRRRRIGKKPPSPTIPDKS